MPDPERIPRPEPTPSHERGQHRIVVLCAECGELIEVADAASLILALHLQNDCGASALLTPRAP
jgi:hypothetical protein